MSIVNSSSILYGAGDNENEVAASALVSGSTQISATASFITTVAASALALCSTVISGFGSSETLAKGHVLGSTQISATAVNYQSEVAAAAQISGATSIYARAVKVSASGARINGKTTISARASRILALSGGLTVFARIIPNPGASPFKNQTARLEINGEEIGIKSFLVNAQPGAVGYNIEVDLARPEISLYSQIDDLKFSLGERNTPGGAISWTELINTENIESRSYQTSFRGRSLSFSMTSGLADKLKIAPRKIIIAYDPDAGIIDVTNFENIPDETGRVLPVEARSLGAMSLYDVLEIAFVEGCGFSDIETNIPNYQTARADFSPTSTFLDSVRGFLGVFDPVILERDGKIIILDTTQVLPAGFEPLELVSSDFTAYREEARGAGEVDGFIVNYIQKATGADYHADRMVYLPEETSGDFGDDNYTRTEKSLRYRDFFSTLQPGVVLDTKLVESIVSTHSTFDLLARETENYTLDVQGKRVSSTKKIESLVPDLNNSGEPVFLTTLDEKSEHLYQSDPKNPGRFIPARTVTRIDGLIAVDSENKYFEKDFKQNFIDAHRAGNLTEEMSTVYGHIKTVTETSEILGNGQVQTKISTIDHLAGTLTNSISDVKTGDISLSARAGRNARLTVWRDGANVDAVNGAKLDQFSLGELPLIFGLPLAKRQLAARLKGRRAVSLEMTGFDSTIRPGQVFKVIDRGASRGNVLVLGYSITGQDLGSESQKITTRLSGVEV